MRVAPDFERAFRKVYGKPCWGVRQGYGSFLTLEFGKPHLVIREPFVASRTASKGVREALVHRDAHARGEWHLWIYCCDWEVRSKGRRVGDSITSAKIQKAAAVLNGQKLVRFSIQPRTLHCQFDFDLGASLKTRPFDSESEQWLLYEPSHRILALRADGRYRHGRSDRPENETEWKPVETRSP